MTAGKAPVNGSSEVNSIQFILKRNGEQESFQPEKINQAVYNCLTDGLGWQDLVSKDTAEEITLRVCNVLAGKNPTPSVEEIQNEVENQLMGSGHFEAAKTYILYRQSREKKKRYRYVAPEELEAIRKSQAYFKHPIQAFQFYSKYSRYNYDKRRRETWEEAVERVITFFQKQVGDKLNSGVWDELSKSILTLQAFPAMRVMQMAGPPLERCNVGVYNCSYVAVDSLRAFSEALYILMQGTGVGYSVEGDHIDKLRRIKKQKANLEVETYVVQDTTEGWCDALLIGMESWFAGKDVNFDFSLIRPAGAPLYTKGGQASGPEPLMGLLEFTKGLILARQEKWLRPIDANDIMCKLAEIVQVGGVRRSSLICLSDLGDDEMRKAKSGTFWNQHSERFMANISSTYNEKPTPIEFMREWQSLVESGTGERGIFNRGSIVKNMPKRRKKADFGVNPCGEIILRSRQFCNLSIAVAREEDTIETLKEKVRIAAIFGTIQSTLTKFEYISDEWKKNSEEERLLGVDITGQMDCPLLRPSNPDRDVLLEELKQIAISTNVEYAEILGINPSVAVTCVKPSGNSAQFLNCSSGIHPRYAEYYIRRVRMSATNPLTQMLKDSGIPCAPENGQTEANATQMVFSFPVKAPDGAITRHDMTALEQLENWLTWKTKFTEHNPSITVYVNDDEWIEVCNWLYKNWDWVGGLSFLPKDNHIYQQAPYEEITLDKYNELMETFPTIDYSKLMQYEYEDKTDISGDYACVSGACDI